MISDEHIEHFGILVNDRLICVRFKAIASNSKKINRMMNTLTNK